MNQVFVYATLLAKGIREQALGADARDVRTRIDAVFDFKEFEPALGTERWPTLEPVPGAKTDGAVLFVTDEDLGRLDRWESRYERRRVLTALHGLSWCYFLREDAVSER